MRQGSGILPGPDIARPIYMMFILNESCGACGLEEYHNGITNGGRDQFSVCREELLALLKQDN